MISLVIMIITVIFLLYYYFKRKYFTPHGSLPGLSPQFFFGNLLQTGVMKDKKLFPAIMRLQREYGDAFQFWLGPSRFVVLGNADDIDYVYANRHIYGPTEQHTMILKLFLHDALICIDGDKHRRHASILTPQFRRSRLTRNLNWMLNCVDKYMLDGWRYSEPGFIHADIIQKAKSVILPMFNYVAFGVDSDLPLEHELHQALYELSQTVVDLAALPQMIIKACLVFSQKYHRAKNIINQYSKNIVEKAQSRVEKHDDDEKRGALTDSLVDAIQKNEMETTKPTQSARKGFSLQEALDEMSFLYLSGYESSWTAITWFIFLMSKHPRIQHKIKEELSKIDKNLTIEQFDSLVYLNAVMHEVLRFAPPFEFTARHVLSDDCLPGTKATINKGDEVFISIHALGRDARYWKIDPELFYPERFLEENADKKRASFSALAFGGGSRKCCGHELALLELKVVATRLMQTVTFGDGGSDVNAGKATQYLATNIPDPIGVTISFD